MHTHIHTDAKMHAGMHWCQQCQLLITLTIHTLQHTWTGFVDAHSEYWCCQQPQTILITQAEIFWSEACFCHKCSLCIEWKSVIMYNANPYTYQWHGVHDNNEVIIIGYMYALLMLAKKKNGGKRVKSWIQSKWNQVVLNAQSMYIWSLTLFTKKTEITDR